MGASSHSSPVFR